MPVIKDFKQLQYMLNHIISFRILNQVHTIVDVIACSRRNCIGGCFETYTSKLCLRFVGCGSTDCLTASASVSDIVHYPNSPPLKCCSPIHKSYMIQEGLFSRRGGEGYFHHCLHDLSELFNPIPSLTT